MEPEKKIELALNLKNIDPISFFEKDSNFVIIFKKTEKLASAVYLITNLFSEVEPLKWALRKKVGDLVSFIIGYKNISESTNDNFVYDVKTRVLELVSLLEICLNCGLVSPMNYSIIKQEFSNLTYSFNLSSTFSKEPFLNPISPTFFTNSEENSHIIKDINNPSLSTTSNPLQRAVISGLKDKINLSKVSDIKRSNRQNTILAVLRKKKDLTIKDIAQVIKDCSEKTIQRELNSFISAGTLKRTGVRRWSRYSLT